MDAMVDLPLAVSPITVGLMAVLLFGRGGWFESWFAARGIQIIFAVPSMVLVTIFICIPFVVRSVAPVLEELGTEEEDAARTLGASSTQTLLRVVLPNIRWGLLYGIALSTARAVGEIGAVLIVSGAIKGQTETATIFILTAFEERLDTQGNIVALTLAAVSIVLLIGDRALQGQAGQGGGVMQPAIKVEHLTKRFGGFTAVDDVSFEAAEGKITALLGPSGSGKSTVLRMIAGLELPTEGKIWMEEEEHTNKSVQERRVGFVFQHYALFRHMTVAQNVSFGLAVRKATKDEQRERVDELLELVQLRRSGSDIPTSSPAASASGSPWRGRSRRGRGAPARRAVRRAGREGPSGPPALARRPAPRARCDQPARDARPGRGDGAR